MAVSGGAPTLAFIAVQLAAGAYTRPLFSSTHALSVGQGVFKGVFKGVFRGSQGV